jgi:5-methylthioadenosine/S-adenosylhomocysteine deaminase
LIRPEWIIPIEPAGITLSGHVLAIDKGRIVDLVPQNEATQRFQPDETLDLPGQVLLPGLINLHTHAAMSLMRGYADDQPLMKWLTEHIWPAEARFVGPDFVRAGTLLACAEMLRGGITTFNDMYFFPQAAAESARRAGMRAVLGLIAIEFPSAYATDADDYLAKGLALRDTLADDPLLSFCLAPHAPYTVADKTFEKIATLGAQLELPVHMHLHETQQEVSDSIKLHGVRPLQRMQRLGLLNPNLIAVHAVHLEPTEIDLLLQHGCHIAHCPTSNMKLGSGIPDMAAIQAHGINFGLGTDGAASNNRLDLFQEMRHAALAAKGSSRDATVLDAHTILRAATLGGARALGQDDRIGSLLPGKCADLCAIRLDDWLIQPCFDPASHLVYVAGRENVTHTLIDGKIVMRDGLPIHIPAPALRSAVALWHNRLTS